MFLKKLHILLIFSLLFSGCSVRKAEKGVFYTAGNWDIPPAYHGNPWAPGGVGAAGPFVHEPLFIYIPSRGEYISRPGESFEESRDNLTLTVRLKKGVLWHDGHGFGSSDVKTTFYIGYLKNLEIWRNLERIECPDENTVLFIWKKPSPTNTIRALTEFITSPCHIFGRWADMVPALQKEKKDEQKVREVLYKYHPEMPVGTGPFRIGKVTSSDIMLDKFPLYYEAENVKINKIRIMRWGSNEVVWSYLIAEEMDGVAPACPFDVAQEILKKNPDTEIVTPSDMSEFGLICNCKKSPVNDLNFRKAVAHILDREMIKNIAYSCGDAVTDYSLAVPKSLRDKWLTKKFFKDLTLYDYNSEKAVKILNEAGYKKNKRGMWLTPEGKEIAMEIIAPSGLTDLILLSEAASSQMTKFGLFTQVRVVPLDLYSTIIKEGNFDFASENGAQTGKYGHPSVSFNRFYYRDSMIGVASGLPSKITYKNNEEIDTEKLSEELNYVMEPEKRDEIVEKLAWVTNEYLPFITCYEKRITIFISDGVRVAGWPDGDDKLWQAAPGGIESIYCTMIVKGLLKPAY